MSLNSALALISKMCEDPNTTSFGIKLLNNSTVRGSMNPSLVSTASDELASPGTDREEWSPDWEVLKSPRSAGVPRVMSSRRFPDGISVRLPGDFHENYLDTGLWPELDPPREEHLRAKLSQLKLENQDLRLLSESLRQRVSASTPNCVNCDQERDKHEKTKIALKQALDLSRVLMEEVKRLDGRTEGGEN